MKRIFLAIVLLSLAKFCTSQTLEDVRKNYLLGRFADAKVALDKAMADAKVAATADAWFYKGRLYYEASKTDATCKNCNVDAFEALKKYQTLDPKNKQLNEMNNQPFFDIYGSFFDKAAADYGAGNFAAAFQNFKNALMVVEYVAPKGYVSNGNKFNLFDTGLVRNVAICARQAKMDADAAVYYEKLAALNLGGDDNLEMYQYLAQHYNSIKNYPAMDAILEKGKKVYPDNNYWVLMPVEVIDKKDTKALFTKYEELVAKNPENAKLILNYASDLFTATYGADPKPAEYEQNKSKIQSLISKVITLKSSAVANLLMAKAIYNNAYDMQEIINKNKGTKPADIKLKTEQKTNMLKMADECIKYADIAATEYGKIADIKKAEKFEWKNCYNLQESMYTLKGNTVKAAEMRKKSDAFK